MGARKRYAEPYRFETDRDLGSDLPRKFVSNSVRNGPGGRSTAERAVLEMGMGLRMVVMCRHRHRRCRGAQLQQKRRPARRHEADGHISPKQQHRQQDAGRKVLSPTIK